VGFIERIIVKVVDWNREVVRRVKEARVDIALGVRLTMGPLQRADGPLERGVH